MIGIYKITNTNNKVYIGQSTNIEKRFKQYIRLSCKGQIKLYNSLSKYGVENHIFEIVEECKIKDLNKKERYWQNHYNVIGLLGLNLQLTETNKLRKEFSKETKLKMSISQTGKKLSQETKDKISKNSAKIYEGKKLSENHKFKMSLAKKGICGINAPRYGKFPSNESRLKMSLAHSKKIIDNNTGTIYESIKKAAIELKLSQSYLGRCLRGKMKSNKNFSYYKNEL